MNDDLELEPEPSDDLHLQESAIDVAHYGLGAVATAGLAGYGLSVFRASRSASDELDEIRRQATDLRLNSLSSYDDTPTYYGGFGETGDYF